jgi:hypothetical protein
MASVLLYRAKLPYVPNVLEEWGGGVEVTGGGWSDGEGANPLGSNPGPHQAESPSILSEKKNLNVAVYMIQMYTNILHMCVLFDPHVYSHTSCRYVVWSRCVLTYSTCVCCLIHMCTHKFHMCLLYYPDVYSHTPHVHIVLSSAFLSMFPFLHNLS